MCDGCNGVDRLVQWCRSLKNIWWMGIESQSRFLAFLYKFRHFTLHTLTGRSSKTVYKFLKKYQHVQHGKSTFVLECEYSRMHTWKPDLIMQKDRHTIWRIIIHNIFQTIISLENRGEKIKLHWLWNSVYYDWQFKRFYRIFLYTVFIIVVCEQNHEMATEQICDTGVFYGLR